MYIIQYIYIYMYALYVLYVCIHVNYMYVFMYIFIYVKRIITSLGEWSESHGTFEPSRSCPDLPQRAKRPPVKRRRTQFHGESPRKNLQRCKMWETQRDVKNTTTIFGIARENPKRWWWMAWGWLMILFFFFFFPQYIYIYIHIYIRYIWLVCMFETANLEMQFLFVVNIER